MPAPPEPDSQFGDAVAGIASALPPDGEAPWVIAAAHKNRLPERYAAAMLAKRLARGGAPVRVIGSSEPLPRGEYGDALPGCVLRMLTNTGATRFVQVSFAQTAEDARLNAFCYDGRDGHLLARAPARLVMQGLVKSLAETEGASLSAADGRWLAAFDRIFPPGPTAEQDASAGAALVLFDLGAWQQAADRLTALADVQADGTLVRAVFALELSGQSQRAQDTLNHALTQKPDNGALYALGAWLALRQGRNGDALMLLEDARLRDMVQEGHYWYARGLIALEESDDETAERVLVQAADLLDGCPFVRIELARFYWNHAQLQSAREHYELAVAAGAADADAHAELAMVLEAAGDAAGAVGALRRAFEMDNRNPGVARQFAALLKRQGEREAALDALRQARDALPCDAGLLTAYAGEALAMWRVEEAEKALRNAVDADPSFHLAAVRLATALRVQGRHREALALVTNLSENGNGPAPALIELGHLLEETGRAADALAAFAEAAKSPNHEAASAVAIARLHIRAEQGEEAVRHAQIAVARQPTAENYALLSESFRAAGDLEKALSTAQTAVEQNADSAAAHLALAGALCREEKRALALREVETAVRLAPYDAQALRVNGELRQAMGQGDQCAALWEKALELNPWDADLHFRLAELCDRDLGDPDRAAAHYDAYYRLQEALTQADMPPNITGREIE
jgi:tetratricopeptide (TPR) repeat protein